MKNEKILLDYIHRGKYYKDFHSILCFKGGLNTVDIMGLDIDGNVCKSPCSISTGAFFTYFFEGMKHYNEVDGLIEEKRALKEVKE